MTDHKKAGVAAPASSSSASESTTYEPECSTSVSGSDKLTVLETVGPTLTKTYKADGTTEAYGEARSFKVAQVSAANLAELAKLLGKLHKNPKRCLIHGAPKPEAEREPGKVAGTWLRSNVNFDDQPLHTFLIDVDGFVPFGADPVREPEAAIQEYLQSCLPLEFQKASYYWHLSSSAGMPGKEDKLKVHLWFWLKTPYTCAQLTEWAKVVGTVVDRAVYRKVQVRYTADPIFEEGRIDPVPVRSGLHQGETDELDLVIDEALLTQAREQGGGSGGDDMKLKDPSEKEGLIGLFHRVFSAENVLQDARMLGDQFEQVTERRYTWHNGGGTPEGVWVHSDQMHVGSSHNTWPIDGIANLWDLVRVLKFGELDETEDDFERLNLDEVGHRPSDQAMYEWAGSLDEIIKAQAEEEEERRKEERSELERLQAEIATATEEELNGRLVGRVRAIKADGAAASTCATLDKAVQQRFKQLSPVKAAPPIAEIRKLTKPEAPKAKGDKRVLDKDNPFYSARAMAKDKFTDEAGQRLAIRTGGEWFIYGGKCYAKRDDEGMKNRIRGYLNRAQRLTDNGPIPFSPKNNDVLEVLNALQTVLASEEALPPPSWLPGYEGPDPRNLIALENGILEARSGTLLDHNPAFFNTSALPFAFDPEATCPQWENFLNQVWPDDLESPQLLQEWAGYLLTTDTRQQKFLMLVGPKRSGKGTITRVLQSILCADDVVSPSLSNLCKEHGMRQLIGKRAAFIGDARGPAKDNQIAVETILNVVGEDLVSVRILFENAPWTEQLRARFTIASNEILTLGDASGALVGRMLLLRTTRSFYGEEDTALADKLLQERAGILNWALEGLRRLVERGRFVQPESSKELLQATAEANDPIGTFTDEYCEFGPDFQVSNALLFDTWKIHCERENRRTGCRETFSKALRASRPELVQGRVREDGKQGRGWKGIRLKPEIEAVMKLGDLSRLQ